MIRPSAIVICCTTIGFFSNQIPAQSVQKIQQPLPLAVASEWRTHNSRSPINLSRDGLWAAHTVHSSDTIKRDSRWFSASGVPLAEGDRRREAQLTNVKTGKVVRLGDPASSSWAPVWSPDAMRVAYYSDESGEAALWIWNIETRKSKRLTNLVVRPAFGFELPCWSADSKRLLVKLLPEGTTIADANSVGRRRRPPQPSGESDPNKASVVVQRVVPSRPQTEPTVKSREEDPTVQKEPTSDTSRFLADLAIIDIERESVNRIVEKAAVRHYAFSPDGLRVAYSVLKGGEPNSQQANFDLTIVDVATDSRRRLAKNVRMAYGNEWSFSPNGKYLAYIPSGQLARLVVGKKLSDERMVLISTMDGKTASIQSSRAPCFDSGDGEYPPLWGNSDKQLYCLGKGSLWRIDRESNRVEKFAEVPGWRLRYVVSRITDNTIWATDGGRTYWALAQEKGGTRSAIVAIDAENGETKIVLEEDAAYYAAFNVDAADATGEMVFVSSDLQHLAGLRMFDTNTRQARYCPALNPGLDQYELGTSTVIKWKSSEGKPLQGALLLPPGERNGPLPLVVWVYGGAYGSKAINRFGLASSGAVFNMHVLATRGYAVLYPDAPTTKPGHTTDDLMSAVMPGVEAAIEQGFADPDRLAIMGQSWGAHNVLSILTKTTRFKAAIITAAVTHPDLFAGYLRSTGFYEKGQGNMGGTIWEFPDRYRNNSPLFRFNRIETPILIGQGERDGDLVPVRAIYRALQRLEKPVEYRLYGGEGHVITRPANVVDFWNRRLEFLAEHLELSQDKAGRVGPK